MALVNHTQVSMLWKSVVAKGSSQSHLNVLKKRFGVWLCSLPPKCRCLKQALSPMALVSHTQVSMLWKSVVAKGSGQSHPSVNALKKCRCQGLRSVWPKCWCSERTLSPRALVSHTQVLVFWKRVVAKGSNQSHPSVDALKERCHAELWSVTPKCWCFYRASSAGALFTPTQMLMLWKGIVSNSFGQSHPSVGALKAAFPPDCAIAGILHWIQRSSPAKWTKGHFSLLLLQGSMQALPRPVQYSYNHPKTQNCDWYGRQWTDNLQCN